MIAAASGALPGVGGVLMRCEDSEASVAWYRDVLHGFQVFPAFNDAV